MNKNITELKKLRRYILTKYNVYSLNFKTSRIQLNLELLDEFMMSRFHLWIQRPRLILNKYHEKV